MIGFGLNSWVLNIFLNLFIVKTRFFYIYKFDDTDVHELDAYHDYYVLYLILHFIFIIANTLYKCVRKHSLLQATIYL